MLPSVEPYANTIDREVANNRVARVLSSSRGSGTVLALAGPPLVEAAAPCREGAGYAKHRDLGGSSGWPRLMRATTSFAH